MKKFFAIFCFISAIFPEILAENFQRPEIFWAQKNSIFADKNWDEKITKNEAERAISAAICENFSIANFFKEKNFCSEKISKKNLNEKLEKLAKNFPQKNAQFSDFCAENSADSKFKNWEKFCEIEQKILTENLTKKFLPQKNFAQIFFEILQQKNFDFPQQSAVFQFLDLHEKSEFLPAAQNLVAAGFWEKSEIFDAEKIPSRRNFLRILARIFALEKCEILADFDGDKILNQNDFCPQIFAENPRGCPDFSPKNFKKNSRTGTKIFPKNPNFSFFEKTEIRENDAFFAAVLEKISGEILEKSKKFWVRE